MSASVAEVLLVGVGVVLFGMLFQLIECLERGTTVTGVDVFVGHYL